MTVAGAEKKEPRITWAMIPAGLLFAVLLPMGTILLGKLIDSYLHLLPFPFFPLNFIVGPLMIGGGILLCLGSIYQLYRLGKGLPWGDIDDPAQSQQLLTTGLYRYTRNPMILGFLIVISGWGWLFQSLTTGIVIPSCLFLLLFLWLKRREEPEMERRFGQAYIDYKKRTPLLIPRPKCQRTKPDNS